MVGGLVVGLAGAAGVTPVLALAAGGTLEGAGADVGLDSGKRGGTLVVAAAWDFGGSLDAGFATDGTAGLVADGGTVVIAGVAGGAVLVGLAMLRAGAGGGGGGVALAGADSGFGEGAGLAGVGSAGFGSAGFGSAGFAVTGVTGVAGLTGVTGVIGFEMGATGWDAGAGAGFVAVFGLASAGSADADFFLVARLGASVGGFATGEAGFRVGATGRAVGRGMGEVGLAAFATLADFFGCAAPVGLVADLALVDFAGTAEGAGIGGAVALTLDLGAEVGELGWLALVEGLLAEVELRDVVVRLLGTRFFSGFITTGGTGFDA